MYIFVRLMEKKYHNQPVFDIEKMKRTHNTDNLEINLERKYPESKKMDFKPKGLWYGINKEWIGWCMGEQPDWLRDNYFNLTLDFKDILVLETRQDVEEFHNKYKLDNSSYAWVNWNKVREDYKAIEFRNFYKIKYEWWAHPTWYYGLDCSCGCIWDLSCIIKIEKNEKRTSHTGN